MKQGDQVFFFTLIDFLLQVFFFGLLMFAAFQASQNRNRASTQTEEAAIESLKKATGTSSIAELTDELSRLVPLSELKGLGAFVQRAGGAGKLKEQLGIVRDAGGPEAVSAKLEKLRKIEEKEGSGLPPCLYTIVGGRKVAKSVATVTASDESIRFESSTPDLEQLLKLIGMDYSAVRELPLPEFRKAFAQLRKNVPDCSYTLHFIERTRYVDARDAARPAFYLNIVK